MFMRKLCVVLPRPKGDTKEFVRFLEQVEHGTGADHTIHVILDNLCTHKVPPCSGGCIAIRACSFTSFPTSSSWLNLVER
jgi:hypothetical protein